MLTTVACDQPSKERAMSTESIRWLFGDQLGPHFLDGPNQQVVLIESKRVFARRRFHRQKAHLVLSAMRHRAVELGERCRYIRADTYAPAINELAREAEVSVRHPTSHAALALVQRLPVELLDARGFVTTFAEFQAWVSSRGKRRLLLEDFYRLSRRGHDLLMDGDEPAGGTWNYDHDNREPPPKSGQLAVPEPWWPVEDEIDDQVRADLDRWERDGEVRFLGQDGPRRFAATPAEAEAAFEHFLTKRLSAFGAYEDAILAGDPWMAHSLLSAPLNLGLLDPLAVARRADEAYRTGHIPIASAEGFIRQVIGWRDYVWHLYWQQPAEYRDRNALRHQEAVPTWFADLEADAVTARCLSETLRNIDEHAWVHHIPRLMILGNYALQNGWNPQQLTDWFHRAFIDGYDWVMVPNVVGMSQHADNGVMATKPYVAGGAYINRMSDYCHDCAYNPRLRTGADACPFTAGYWAFLHRHRDRFAANPRMSQAVRGLDRLSDLDALLEDHQQFGTHAP
jgi:deoxyribodipyrimidine photolyase-related protein